MSVLPDKILLATDGSKEAELAARFAVELARKIGSELHVVHVFGIMPWYPVYPEGTDLGETEPEEPLEEEDLRRTSERRARALLDAEVEKLGSLGGSVERAYLREGGAAQEIVWLAEEIGAGLIVMGSRGLGGVRRALMGSVSDSVVCHAHCPVMIARWKPVVFPANILLATDGSEEARLASTTAEELARRTGSELHVAHVGVELTHGAFPAVQVGPLPGVHQDELDRQAKGLLEAETERLKSSGTAVAESHLRRGRVDREIALLAEEMGVDLIVMGSRGLGGIRRALMGSVSDSVVRHAHCPVIVVRPEKERTVEREGDFLT